MQRTAPFTWIVFLLTVTGQTHAQPPPYIEAGTFSSSHLNDGLPAYWQSLTFSHIARHTGYSLVEDEGTVVIKAVSDQSASGLARAITIEPAHYPVIEWRWKVNNTLQKGDVTRKAGDDYPARIYVSFAFDPDRAGYLARLKHAAARLIHGEEVPYRTISYVWGNNSEAGTMLPNAYTDQVMMFVVRDAHAPLQKWLAEHRNVYDDYSAAFGEEPTTISGMAIMTDTDNTGESAIAWYGDIVFTAPRGGTD